MNTNTTEMTVETGKAPTKSRKANSSKRRMAREPDNPSTTETASTADKSQHAGGPVRATSKIPAVIVLLKRAQGATLAEMVAATGWLPHTTRPALARLKKKGHVITKDKRDDVTCYRITEAA